MPDAPKSAPNISDAPVADEEKRKSRLKRLMDEGRTPDVPDAGLLYVERILFNIGPTIGAGMGSREILSSDVESWERKRGIVLSPWEDESVRMLSREYIATMHASKAPETPPPWQRIVFDHEEHERIERRIKSVLRS